MAMNIGRLGHGHETMRPATNADLHVEVHKARPNQSTQAETQDIQQELAPVQVFRTLFDRGTVP